MKEKFLSWQGIKRRELFLSCCGFDSYISFVGKKLLSAFGTVNSILEYCTIHFLQTDRKKISEYSLKQFPIFLSVHHAILCPIDDLHQVR